MMIWSSSAFKASSCNKSLMFMVFCVEICCKEKESLCRMEAQALGGIKEFKNG
jgi:hypothetical protein